MDHSGLPTFNRPAVIPRRTLGQHNPGTSPIKTLSAHSSPRVTPTKGPNPYGDRFIPLRQPNSEWNARYCAINNPEMEEPTFKKPMGNSNRANTMQNTQDFYGTGVPGGGGSEAGSPTGQVHHMQACFDDSRRDEMVVRALLRNEMLKERIDDVKDFQLQILPTEEQLASYSSAPVVVGAPLPSSSGIFPQMERNAYGGSNESLVLPVNLYDDTMRYDRGGAVSPTFEMLDVRRAGIGAGGGGSTNGANTPNPSAAGSTCGESPRQIPIPLSPVSTIHSSPARSLFTYSAKLTPNKYGSACTSVKFNASPFSGPLGEDSQRLLRTPRKPQRKVPKNPYKVLDAPELQDDFYLNLVDWSSQNQLAVGLSTCVYLWSATTSQVTKLCDLATEQDTVTSVQWGEKGEWLAVGTQRGMVQIWDATTLKKIRELSGHTQRVGCLAWNGESICSGSRDRTIIHRDSRCSDREEPRKLNHHRQEVCGLKWSPDKQLLASGGNDNQLLVWNLRRDEPLQTFRGHKAAVKALAWSPHQSGLLASGGGAADAHLRFWNVKTGKALQCVDTGSQVCNILWSRYSNELVSVHGFSESQTYAQHNAAVKALAWSPHHHGLLVSGGGTADRCLRFWNTLTAQPMQCIDTGSQVCNVIWSKHSNELVSTHGYSYNHVIIWKYPNLQPVTKLVGHQSRVLYLAMSPDGESIVTGAGDETLRFWHVFNKGAAPKISRSKLNLLTSLR